MQLNHTQSSLTPPFPIGSWKSRHPGGVLRVSVWREQDAMRQCGIGFEVIPRSFRDEKQTIFASLQPRALTVLFEAASG
jgi:hypothetical protein